MKQLLLIPHSPYILANTIAFCVCEFTYSEYLL